jgi:hypothetical protein
MKSLLAFAVLSLLLISCDPCNNIECVTDNATGQFRITSATNGSDLVFGPARVYDKNQIKFYSMAGTDTNFIPSVAIPYNTNGIDSIIVVHFLPKPDIAYMRLSNGDIDTFNISYTTRPSKCCGNITDIVKFNFNQGSDVPKTNNPVELKK